MSRDPLLQFGQPNEGLLAGVPQFALLLDIERVACERPRPDAMAALVTGHRSLSALVLGDMTPKSEEGQALSERRSVNHPRRILDLLRRSLGHPEGR